MIGYVTLGTNDLARAAPFYDALAAELGTGRMMAFDGYIAWGTPGGGAGIGLTRPFDGNPASIGNGVMVALEAKDRAQVDRLHALALAHGGTCEGPPGQQAQCLCDGIGFGVTPAAASPSATAARTASRAAPPAAAAGGASRSPESGSRDIPAR